VSVAPPERLKDALARSAEAKVAARWRLFAPECDERRRRLWAAAEARTHGFGGVALVARATGIAQETIRRGLAELDADERLEPGRVRRPGGGRKPIKETDPGVVEDLERLVDPATRGDPDSPLRWTSKSLPKLAGALVGMGHQISADTVGALLRLLGYRLQANRKTRAGSQHPDRDAQFEHINRTVEAALAAGQPVISVDTKKKELVGDFKNAGREWHPSGQPELVRVHDFKDQELGKAIPYGVYDVGSDEGFVAVGITADTAQFSVAAIRAWWQQLGAERYPDARTLTITADCGGSNGNRTRLWKTELAAPRRRDRPGDRGPALPARHLEVEQGRAPAVLLHRPELARAAAHKPPGDHRADRRDDDQHRPHRLRPARRERLPQGAQGLRPGARRRQPHPPSLAPRMELRDRSRHAVTTLSRGCSPVIPKSSVLS
jgi:hypothetical protein